jgi:hypothetical protein
MSKGTSQNKLRNVSIRAVILTTVKLLKTTLKKAGRFKGTLIVAGITLVGSVIVAVTGRWQGLYTPVLM